jgi:hypothetical protein
LFEPDEYITDDEIYVVNNSVVIILPATFKFWLITTEPVIFELPFTANPPLIEVGAPTTNPLFGEICAIAEPDLILSISPIASESILNNPLPSPLKRDADIDDEILSEPVIWVSDFNLNGLFPNESISSVCILEALKFPTTSTDCDEKLAILLPLTNKETVSLFC